MEEKFLAGETITTLVVRNIPPRFTLEHLLCQWPVEIDFLYLPNSFESAGNLSFAFVNFTSAAAAEAFREQWHKKRLPGPRSRKALDIGAAEVQGLTQNLARFGRGKCGRIKNPSFLPAVRCNGRLVDSREARRMFDAAAAM